MATSTTSDVLNPEILTETVQGVFSGKDAFNGSRLASAGVAIVNGTMPEGGPDALGTTIKVPRFGVIGEFEEVAENTPGTPSKIGMEVESATITHDYLGFEATVWARANGKLFPGGSGDPYTEAARQILQAANRRIDFRLITAAMASGVFKKDVYSTSAPVTLSYDLAIDARFDAWGDEQDDLAAILVHSQTTKDLLKLKDGQGNPLLTATKEGGPLDNFAGLAVITSDRLPLTGSSMSTPVSSGTSPPVLTITGTPLGAYRLQIDCTLGGAHATAKYRFSTDGGNTWSEDITTLGVGVAQDLIDPSNDSVVGQNGKTGLQVAFAAGTFNADNLWTSQTVMKTTSILLKRNALAFWFNQSLLRMKTDEDIRRDTNEAAMHLYGAAHRYQRRPLGTRPGVAHIVHNVSSFV